VFCKEPILMAGQPPRGCLLCSTSVFAALARGRLSAPVTVVVTAPAAARHKFPDIVALAMLTELFLAHAGSAIH
jgi:hypothetical protein